MKLLIAEDDNELRAYLRTSLMASGFVVDAVANGVNVLAYLKSSSYDLLILDVMMPGMDGLEVLRRIRTSGNQVPVLMLSGRHLVEDRVKGLELGADDYLIKPFALTELLARVNTLLRRRGNQPQETRLAVADLELDLISRKASRGGHRIELTSREFVLLELLLRRRDEALSKSLIASQVWGIDFDSGTNVIEVAIRRLRAKIDDDFEIKLIHTVRGMGYRLEVPATT
ncbi:heavy metal response regulator transcription factor [Pseudomonas sp. XK-1]|uniref:heavy metal response regulator transcription factor n=1 Tax=Pseudomonas sp. XK-1 TaxID=3136019 RepID=UPI0031198800